MGNNGYDSFIEYDYFYVDDSYQGFSQCYPVECFEVETLQYNNDEPYVLETLKSVYAEVPIEEYEEVYHDDSDEVAQQENEDRPVFECPECDKKYTSERRLKHHLELHKNKEAFKCDKCGYCYQSPDSLHRHLKKSKECSTSTQELESINTESMNTNGILQNL